MKRQYAAGAVGLSAQHFLQRQVKVRHLRLLVELDRHRKISQTAVALSLSQPAISKALAEIENGLDVMVFQRTPHGLEPTPEGACLIRHARMVVESLSRAAFEMTQLGKRESWHVVVGAMYGTASVVVRAIEQLHTLHASCTVTIREGSTDELLMLMRSRSVDLVVGGAPEPAKAVDLMVTPLYVEPMVWMIAARHPLLDKRPLTLHDLTELVWVLPPRHARIRTIIDAVFEQVDVSPSSRVIETLSFEVAMRLVATLDAVVLCSRRSAKSAEQQGIAAILDIEMPGVFIHVSSMFQTRESEASRPTRLVNQMLVEAAARLEDAVGPSR